MKSITLDAINVNNALQNYIWMLRDESHQVVAIDPTDADLVIDYCNKNQLQLSEIWLTHWHHDHTAGVPGLKQYSPQVKVIAPYPKTQPINGVEHQLADGDQWHWQGIRVAILAVPGHTLDHIAYFIQPKTQPAILLSGDTLFSMGCGRVFEGDYAQMFASLQRIKALPLDTEIYCSHEYTETNARFALKTLPNNNAIQQRAEQVFQLRKQQKITLPVTLSTELATNPFLLCQDLEQFSLFRDARNQFT